ncbi:class A beta-lactamase-related serine hydrolase [Clostridium botulinum]|uniref:serine hydrolase domain-containing protein n=1 Tax=Clostridium TaxID=1485 RepID=UPI0013FB4FD7|nr:MULTISPECIES: serine hydrolase domain-containing protein [Clostridium]MCS6132721.1 class A beta-lactamase-related serine hydrolase [Clostridium botulinum]NFL44350.1 beta-lactamase family protein [Clostridium botulinum]NFL88573.1 beta-lactamase family protein [Clostridium botulinum]
MRNFMKEICEHYSTEKNFSGVCVLKIKGETIFEKAYGYANRGFKIKNQIDTSFDTASVTKVFTAVAILQLAQQGKLKLDDKIVNLIDLEGTKIPKDVTVHQLLNHTSGIADDADEEAGEDYAALFINSPNYAIRECKDFLKNFAYKEPNFKAGSNVRYCNCSFILLGIAIEKITGMKYQSYVTEHIFKKMDMHGTGFFSMDSINENTAEGYVNITNTEDNIIGYKKNIYSYPPIGAADGGAYTTAEDLNKFLIGIKNCTLLNKEYSNILMDSQCDFCEAKEVYKIPQLYKTNGYAFEFFKISDKKEPFSIYKDGCNYGVSAMFSYYPEKDISLVILSNQECDVWTMRREIQLELYKKYYSI